MAVLGDKYVYIGMTKTASNWFDKVLEAHAGGAIKWKHHSYFDPKGEVDRQYVWQRSCDVIPEEYRAGRKVITCVREPFDMVKSFWKFRMKGGWGGWLLDQIALANAPEGYLSLNQFVDALVSNPFPALTYLYNIFTKHADYVCRFEHLPNDLVNALHAIEVQFDENALKEFPKVNVTKEQPAKYAPAASYLQNSKVDTDLLSEFIAYESEAYNIWKNAGIFSHSL